MDIALDTSTRVPVVRVTGEMRLDLYNRSNKCKEVVVEAFQTGPRVVLDVSRVQYMDSFGVGCVAECLALAIAKEWKLDLIVPPGLIHQALDRARLLTVCRSFETEEAAMETA